jgi:hypothetical protein
VAGDSKHYSSPRQERAAKRRQLNEEIPLPEPESLANIIDGDMQDFERLNSGEDISMPSEDDALEPNHYLSVLRQHMKSPPLLRNWRSDYAGLADSKGTSGIETTIIQSLDSRLRLLVETRLLDLESLGACNGLNPRDTERPGVYIHVMYNPMDHSIVGAYTGQAMNMSRRISEHEKALENAQNGKLRESERKTSERNSAH